MRTHAALLLFVALSGASGLPRPPSTAHHSLLCAARVWQPARPLSSPVAVLCGLVRSWSGEPALHPCSPVPAGPRVLTSPCLPSVALCRAAFMAPVYSGGKLMLRASGAKSMSAVLMQVDEKKS